MSNLLRLSLDIGVPSPGSFGAIHGPLSLRALDYRGQDEQKLGGSTWYPIIRGPSLWGDEGDVAPASFLGMDRDCKREM